MRQRWAFDGYEQRVDDMHALKIATDGVYWRDGKWQDNGRWESLQDYSAISSCGTVKVIFRDLERRLVEMIHEADYVYGCVAWLTSEPVLQALAAIQGAQIVVQKEDFLRPDIGTHSSWALRLRYLYDQIKNPLDRYEIPGTAAYMSSCGDPTIEAIRCVGNHNTAKQSAFPRSHHKFVIFAKLGEVDDDLVKSCAMPYAVWTGSFNFTKNAGRSFENAVVLTDPFVVAAYEREWSQILALSEPLDWDTPWAAPEWRIGT